MDICSTPKSRCASQFVPKCQIPHPKLSYDFAKFAAFANSGQVKSNLLTPYTHCNICFCFWGHIRCLRALILELHSLSKSLPKRQRSTQISLKYSVHSLLWGSYNLTPLQKARGAGKCRRNLSVWRFLRCSEHRNSQKQKQKKKNSRTMFWRRLTFEIKHSLNFLKRI